MAADRESQTMGLREAFFLGRLNPASKRGRAPSPLRSPRGSVHVIRLIAVKEDVDGRRSTHGRSVSDAIKDEPKVLTRQRSSTFTDEHGLSSFPSLPSLAHGAKDPPLSLSRLVLLIEHAPLGTLDRLLRTSPDLVGRQLWECWARQGADALEWVHSKGVVHCDVKPGNLLVSYDLDRADASSHTTSTSACPTLAPPS
jgi:serine/threonine protein kinase